MSTLSVCIPNYNHGRYLPDCLEGILGQSRQPDEILIVDDASRDNSVEIIKRYQKRFPHIHLLQHAANQGLSQAINNGLAHTRGEIMALCAADDILTSGFFAEGMECFSNRPQLGLVFSDLATFQDGSPERLRILKVLPALTPTHYVPEQTIALCRDHRFTVPSQACLYRRSLLLQYGGYPAQIGYLADYYLNARIALRHPIYYLPKVYGHVRIADNSMGEIYRKNLWQRKKALEIFFGMLGKEDAAFKKAFRQARHFAQTGWAGILLALLRPALWPLLPGAILNRSRFHT